MDRRTLDHDIKDVITDFVELIAKAFFGGLGAAVLMGLAILALSASAQAAPFKPTQERGAHAPIDRNASGVGALWARTYRASARSMSLPQDSMNSR